MLQIPGEDRGNGGDREIVVGMVRVDLHGAGSVPGRRLRLAEVDLKHGGLDQQIGIVRTEHQRAVKIPGRLFPGTSKERHLGNDKMDMASLSSSSSAWRACT